MGHPRLNGEIKRRRDVFGIFSNKTAINPHCRRADGAETGFDFITIRGGRRLAQLFRARLKQIKTSEPIRCVLESMAGG